MKAPHRALSDALDSLLTDDVDCQGRRILAYAPDAKLRSLLHHDRAWWCIEARGCGSHWPGILRLQAEVLAAWRVHHDCDRERAAA